MQKESYGSVTVFWLDRDEALRRLRDAARGLVQGRGDVVAVYLFGSLAEGRAVPGSDADVLILLSDSSRRWLDRPLEFQPYFRRCGVGVELFCYTGEEAEEVPLARRARERGIVLAARV
ncbi:MAG: nucleotidyltransferase domain-containing protein [Gemmatimonadetes bacterium]|nr:nucleotidyltransferase domain-containing protein [Gemmatimonadota bacterium]